MSYVLRILDVDDAPRDVHLNAQQRTTVTTTSGIAEVVNSPDAPPPTGELPVFDPLGAEHDVPYTFVGETAQEVSEFAGSYQALGVMLVEFESVAILSGSA